MLDASFRAFVVIGDEDRAVLDAHVLQLHVALGLIAGWLGHPHSGLLALRGRVGAVVGAKTDRQHRTLQHHALGLHLPGQKSGQVEIEHEPRHREIGGAGPRLGIGESGVGDDDMGTGREHERGRAVDRELAAGLLLDAGGNTVAHRVRRNQKIDGDQRDNGDGHDARADHEQKLHGSAAKHHEPASGAILWRAGFRGRRLMLVLMFHGSRTKSLTLAR